MAISLLTVSVMVWVPFSDHSRRWSWGARPFSNTEIRHIDLTWRSLVFCPQLYVDLESLNHQRFPSPAYWGPTSAEIPRACSGCFPSTNLRMVAFFFFLPCFALFLNSQRVNSILIMIAAHADDLPIVKNISAGAISHLQKLHRLHGARLAVTFSTQ